MEDATAAAEAAAPVVVPVTPAPISTSAPKPAPDVEAIVRAWVATELANSPVSRATDAWNTVQAALPHLIASLKEI
jgi:hypothetical protein